MAMTSAPTHRLRTGMGKPHVDVAATGQSLVADELPAAVSVRGLTDPTIRAWSRGAEVLYGYAASDAIGSVKHELLASIFPVPLRDIEEIVRAEGEWLGAVREQRGDGTLIVVLTSWRLRQATAELPAAIIEVALPLALEREAGAARELVLDGTVARLLRKGVLQTAELLERDATVARLELQGEDQTAEMVLRDATVARLELQGVGQTAELEELDAFAYSVSHDLRTPLRAINAYALALREDHGDSLSPAALSDLDRIQRAATRMGALIDDLLRLSRITRTIPRRRRLDLAEIAREFAARAASGVGSSPQASWEIDEHAWAVADKGLLEIALENLLGNALKFTANGATAAISFSSADSPEGRIFTVRDTGVGFDMEHAGNLFMPFHRLHSTTEFAGTGIGLAIVKRIVRRHEGRVWAEAKVGVGTAIHFTLPTPGEDTT